MPLPGDALSALRAQRSRVLVLRRPPEGSAGPNGVKNRPSDSAVPASCRPSRHSGRSGQSARRPWDLEGAWSDHLCCAERNLLDRQLRCAVRHGVRPSGTVAWLRRKFGGHVTVRRERADGSDGCSFPCVLCRRALIARDLTVHAVGSDGQWFHGRLTDTHTPASDLFIPARRG